METLPLELVEGHLITRVAPVRTALCPACENYHVVLLRDASPENLERLATTLAKLAVFQRAKRGGADS